MSVSVIIKTLNEEKRIARTIEFALAGLPGGRGEVIVADSGSSDATVEIASRYPVRIVQIENPARPSCGIGPQLGFQYARQDFICLIDGDMDLDPGFLPEALAYLDRHPKAGGVTGHVEEMMLDNLEYTRRVQRNAPENRTGAIDRMNGGGLYRRAAVENIGYLTDRNLHGYEEFDLGIRLRHAGWSLFRLDRRFVRHYGHNVNSYRLLVRRWKTKYLFGIGELLRASFGKPYFARLLTELPELRLWALVAAWILFSLGLLIAIPDKLLALGSVLGIFAAVVALMSWRKGNFKLGLYTVVAWLFHTMAVPFGFFAPRRDPGGWVESREIGDGDEKTGPHPGSGARAHGFDQPSLAG
ncbi:glycosyltransferase [Rhizobium sp. YS-1r]|uniref:glycosyltransferase n=1 Tax=Rhizobium sp. YS-1r TaxID=1532558 RepID=UPI0009DF16D1|nr:glycosyltransferase [Rhizobium sp. YS-1r]